jgi:hypothetical protein
MAASASRWLRREDSNLQSPDPESGGLPISRLLSAIFSLYRDEALVPIPAGKTRPFTICVVIGFAYTKDRKRRQESIRSSVRGSAVTQDLSVMVDEFVAAL